MKSFEQFVVAGFNGHKKMKSSRSNSTLPNKFVFRVQTRNLKYSLVILLPRICNKICIGIDQKYLI